MASNSKKTRVKANPPKGDYLRVIPMGGLEDVGMNCCLIECNGSMIMLDCGLTFPDSDGYGVDVIVPDLSFVMDNLDMLDAVVLTHGHEDHIGALPFFLREVDVPVYGGRLTLAMVGRKLEETPLDGPVRMNPVEPGDRVEIGEFAVEFIHTNHSVPNAMSVAIETPVGRLIFTGDWKLDQTPIGEPPMDLQRFAALGADGVLALLADSTNSGTPGFSRSEADVQEGLAGVLETAEGRVIVAQFSSNIYRVQGMLELAEQFGRKVALQGRSMHNNFGLAQGLGFIKVPKGVLIDLYDVHKYPDEEILIVSTGSQGEPRAALTRMAYGSHNKLDIKPTDTVVLSARVIPGNERGIQNVINELTKRGASVITQKDRPIHASGHAKRGEMKLLLNLVKPTHLIPMHGTYRMRKQHAELAETVGVRSSQVIENGDVLQFNSKGKPTVIERVHVGRIFVDGRSSAADIEDVQLRDRKALAFAGIIVAHLVVNRSSGKVVSGPELMHRGFLNDEEEDLLPAAGEYVLESIERMPDSERRNSKQVAETLRQGLRRYFRKQLDRKPVVIPIVHEA
jgi:ribonuclease J